MAEKSSLENHPLGKLDLEDLNLVVQFVLLSGSIKVLAAFYGISYPTMRARRDSLIERIEKAAAGGTIDPMADCLADLVERELISIHTARKIRDLHRKMLDER